MTCSTDAPKRSKYPAGLELTHFREQHFSDRTLGPVTQNCCVQQVMNQDGCTSSIKDKILTVEVKAGWKEGTKIIFPKEGDQVNDANMRHQFSAVELEHHIPQYVL